MGLLATVSLIGGLALTQSALAQGGCGAVTFTGPVASQFPEASNACLDIVTRENKQYAHFKGEIVSVSGSQVRARFKLPNGQYSQTYAFTPKSGSRVRIAGEGETGSGGAPGGDLYLRIRLAPNPTFERKGQDLYLRVPVPLTTAVLGGEANVQTLGGKSLRLKIPPTTQHGQMFRLKGHGMPIPGKPGEFGDLYATADVQLPRELTPEQRSHFEALQKLERAS